MNPRRNKPPPRDERYFGVNFETYFDSEPRKVSENELCITLFESLYEDEASAKVIAKTLQHLGLNGEVYVDYGLGKVKMYEVKNGKIILNE